MAEWLPKPDEDDDPDGGADFLTNLFDDAKVDVGVEAGPKAGDEPAKGAADATVTDDKTKVEAPPAVEPVEPAAGDEPAKGADGDDPGADDSKEADGTEGTQANTESELDKVRAEWGEMWLLEKELRQLGTALRSGNNLAFIEGLEKLSPTRADGLVKAILDAKAEEHIASKYKIANAQALGQRLEAATAVEVPSELDALLKAMPDEHAKAIRDVYAEAQRAQKEKAEAFSELEKARGAIRETFDQQAEAGFKQDFEKVQVGLLGELLPATTAEDTVTSVRAAMLHRFLFELRGDDGRNLAEDAITALEESTLNHDSPKLIEANRQKVADLMEKALRKELASRGLKPAEVSKKQTSANLRVVPPTTKGEQKGNTAATAKGKTVAPQGKAARQQAADVDLDDMLQNLGIIPKAAAK